MDIFVNFWLFLRFPLAEILSCHVAQDANFGFFIYFFLILHLTLEKVTEFPVEELSSYQQKASGGGPPSAFSVNPI